MSIIQAPRLRRSGSGHEPWIPFDRPLDMTWRGEGGWEEIREVPSQPAPAAAHCVLVKSWPRSVTAWRTITCPWGIGSKGSWGFRALWSQVALRMSHGLCWVCILFIIFFLFFFIFFLAVFCLATVVRSAPLFVPTRGMSPTCTGPNASWLLLRGGPKKSNEGGTGGLSWVGCGRHPIGRGF